MLTDVYKPAVVVVVICNLWRDIESGFSSRVLGLELVRHPRLARCPPPASRLLPIVLSYKLPQRLQEALKID